MSYSDNDSGNEPMEGDSVQDMPEHQSSVAQKESSGRN